MPVEEVDDEELVPTPESARRQPETQVEYTRRFKRKAETDREQLEREIREDSEELLQTNMDFDWFWVGSGEPVLVASLGTLEGPASFAPATSPEMFSGSLDSVCFNRGNEHDFVKMRLGGQDVLVWKPDSIIDDQSLQELDLEQGFKGMQEEVRNLEHCKTGRIITQSELDDMKKAVPNLRLIQSRWVAAYKSSERVSCTHESEEVEAADMGCVLARGCDSCTHEPWFCGLKFGDEVGLGDGSNLETCFVNDPSRDLCATVPMKVVLVRAHDWFDDHSEVSVEQQIEPYFEFLRPLLSQVADNTDASWWLLDSGASTSVLAESNLSAFRSVLQDSEGLGSYKAANGSSVNMSGTAEIGVQMHMSGTSGDDWCWKKARLNVLVGSIRHNILSITSLADSGWRFTQGPKGFDLFHEKLGMHCLDVAYFANCPWVRLYPDVGSSSAYRSDLTVSNTHDFSVAAVSGGDDSELARHRRQGHIPFNPNCLECAKGRSVFQHRRDKGDRKEVSIQADFAFLKTSGEIAADELPGSVKILVLTEMMSRCIGYVVVGEDVEATRRQIVVWLQHFGLTSKAVSIDVHTDSERAVGEIIGSSTGRYTFAIRRAAPQQHRSIGSAERAVRELKESFSVLRADLNAQGLDVTFSHENLVDVLTYLALCNNHFSTSRGSDRSPLEMVSGRKLSKPVSTLFGAQVLAEIPDSIRQHSPLSTRNVECTFIHMGLERGPVVQGLIRVDGKAELMRFVARNIRAISPLRWDLNSGQGVLTQFDTGTVGSRPQIVNDSGTAPADMSQLPPEELRKLKGQSLPAPSQPKLVLPESSSVKKKSGELRLAPAVPLARSNVAVTPQEVPAEPSRVSVTPSPTSPADTADVAIGSPESCERTSPDVSRFEPTRRCPACESGMEARKHLVLGTTRNVESVLLSLRNNGERKDVLNLHSLRRAL